MDLKKIAPTLELSEDGWWSSPKLSDVSYPDEGNGLCFLVEESSLWFEHRNRCILQSMQLLPPAGVLLDVGGGNGYVARAIQESGLEVVLLEPGLTGIRNAAKRGVRQLVRATLGDAGISPESVPAVGLFDVVEHIRDDCGFMTEIRRLLTPGGRVYVTVPAHSWLWSDEDIVAGHWRRYTISTLRLLLERAGYTVEFVTYIFGFLPIPILFRRVLPFRLGFATKELSESRIRSDHGVVPPGVATIIRLLNRRELFRIARNRPLIRMGGSCLAVANRLG